VDLNVFEPEIENMSSIIEDEFYDPSAPRYIKSSQQLFELEELGAENPVTFDGRLAAPPIRLWRELAPDNVDNSGVTGLCWDAENHLHGICGNTVKFAFETAGNRLISLKPLKECTPEYAAWLEGAAEPRLSQYKTGRALPSYPGRQYKAIPHVDVEFSGGRRLIGTLDGMLAIDDGDHIFSLGPAAPNGPIHAMSANPEKTILYGIAGDPEDMGSVFTYDDRNGLLWKGFVVYEAPDETGVVCCTNLSCCTVSRDGRYLAIASDERLGTVLIYQL
jgi:hypothetical protein